MLRLGKPIQRQQAPSRGPVMAGAEGERRLDLDPNLVRRNPRPVMRAVNGESAGLNWLELAQARGDPVLRGDLFKGQPRGAVRPGELTHRQPYRVLIGRRLEVDF